MLQFDLDNEGETIMNYRERVGQCEALGEFAMAEEIREILRVEQEHQIDLATALNKDVPTLRTEKAGRRPPLTSAEPKRGAKREGRLCLSRRLRLAEHRSVDRSAQPYLIQLNGAASVQPHEAETVGQLDAADDKAINAPDPEVLTRPRRASVGRLGYACRTPVSCALTLRPFE